MGGELGEELIAPSIMECEGGRGVRGCIYIPSIMEYDGGRGVRGMFL